MGRTNPLFRRFGRRHVAVVVMMMMVVVMVVVVMMRVVMLHRRGSGWRGFLRERVAREADGQRGGGEKALDHVRHVLSKAAPTAAKDTAARRLNRALTKGAISTRPGPGFRTFAQRDRSACAAGEGEAENRGS